MLNSHQLWIAFRLYLWGIGDTQYTHGMYQKEVVNCFQIVSLRYWWHLQLLFLTSIFSCELLSDCIFEVLVTPFSMLTMLSSSLWIAFRLYLWGIGDTKEKTDRLFDVVVNCFQIVSLRYWWHQKGMTLRQWIRCELLSDCIFEVLVTPRYRKNPCLVKLWIAFRLYLWGIGDTT